MKNLLILIALTSFLFGCSKGGSDPVDPVLVDQRLTGEWTTALGGGGGFNNFESFKNFQYVFEVPNANQVVNVGLISPDINVQYALFDPLGQRIETSATGRKLSKPYTLNAGKYRVVVTSDRRAVGKFELTMLGVNGEPARIPSQMLQSGTQNWGKLGGGGTDKSFKNHFYTFDVTEDNSSIDFELESADTEVTLALYDELGTRTELLRGDRYEFKIKAAKRGKYTIMAGTNTRGSVGNYVLRVIGKVGELKRIESQVTTVTGNWPTNAAADTYSLRLTSTTNSPLDIELSSPDAGVLIYLQSAAGAKLESAISYSVRVNSLTSKDLPPGTYRIQVTPFGTRDFGNYTLTVHGQFTDFKKL